MIWNVYIMHHGQPTDVIPCKNRVEARKASKCYPCTLKTKKHSSTDNRLRVKLAAYLEARGRMYRAAAQRSRKPRNAKPVNLVFSFMNEAPQMEHARRVI